MDQPTNPTSESTSQGTQPSNNNPFVLSPTGERAEETAVNTPESQTPVSTQPTTPTETQPAVAPATPATASTPQTAPLSREDLRAIVSELMPKQTAASPQQTQQPMTQEQFRQHYNVPTIDAKMYESVLGVAPSSDSQVQALNNLVQSPIRAAVMMANDIIEARLSDLNGRLDPVFAAHVRASNDAADSKFYKAHPDLTDDRDLVNEIRDAMTARGIRFPDEAAAFAAVATQARQFRERLKGRVASTGAPASQPTTVGGQTKPTQTQTPVRQMTPGSSGGRSGTGVATSKPIAEQIFG